MEIERNIRGIRKKNKYSGDENSEKNLKKILDIFFPNCRAEKTKIKYEPEHGNRKVSYFEIDSLVNFKNKKLAFEYDGPPHFNTIFTIEKDLRKTKVLEDLGFAVHSVPYFVQFTKDIAKYFFEDYGVYTDEKYEKMLREVYKVEQESDILGPGWQGTTETPANFVTMGLDLLLQVIDDFPKSLKCQLVHSLNLNLAAAPGKEWLICPKHHEAFNKLLMHKPELENINYFYAYKFD
tara:strand:- start:2158 stop:2865 length:708 start_codon:yes stop_codon:yes gene_type:complete